MVERRYKVSWYDDDGKRRSVIVATKAEMVRLVEDKAVGSSQVSVKAIDCFRLEEGES